MCGKIQNPFLVHIGIQPVIFIFFSRELAGTCRRIGETACRRNGECPSDNAISPVSP